MVRPNKNICVACAKRYADWNEESQRALDMAGLVFCRAIQELIVIDESKNHGEIMPKIPDECPNLLMNLMAEQEC